jgi:hypothetical protein
MGSNPACTNKTSGCRVRAYKHGNFGGPNHGVGQNDPNECRKDAGSGCCVDWRGISSYKVSDCGETVVIAGHYNGNGYAQPMGSSGPLDFALAVTGDVGSLPAGWNDHLQGFSFHTTPSANANQLSYDIATRGINKGQVSEIALPKQGISADREDVILGTSKNSEKAAKPCPGGTGSFLQGATKVRCLYSKTDADKMKNLYDVMKGSNITNDPRAAMHSSLKTTFCRIPGNVFTNPGGGSCLEDTQAKETAKEYCSVGARINGKGDGASCTSTNLGENYYKELAESYCKTTTGKADLWCSCYNVTQGVCDTDSSAAGCDKKRRGFDKLVEGTPSEFKTQWNGMEGCFEGVCQGAKYVPENANQNCDRPVQICVQDFDFRSISGGSTINATCNQNAGTGTSVGDGSSGSPSYTPSGAPSGTTYPSGSVSEKLDTSFRSKLPKSVRPFIPVSFDEVKTDSNKMIGVGSSGFSSIISIVLIIVLLVASSSGGSGGGRPMRFRR